MSEVSILGPPIGYTDILRDHLSQRAKKELEVVKQTGGLRNPLRPSSAGRCERELAYELMEFTQQNYYEKQPLDPEKSLIFSLGHSIEYHLLQQFKNIELFRIAYKQQSLLFFPIEAENPKLRIWIEGSADGTFIGINHDWKCLFDVKSKKVKHSNSYSDSWTEDSQKFSAMQSMIKIPDSQDAYWIENVEDFIVELNDPFLAQNIIQLNMYANSDFMKTKGFDHCSLLYYNKNDSRIREIRFKPSVSLYEKVKVRFQSAASAVDKKNPELAKKEYSFGSMKCAFCNYSSACWDEEIPALKAWFKTFPKKYWPKTASEVGASDLLSSYIALEQKSQDKDHVKKQLMDFMYENKIYKLQTEFGGPVYELKIYKSRDNMKNSMDIKRGKA